MQYPKSPSVKLIKWDTKEEILKNLFSVYHTTKLHLESESIKFDRTEAEKLYKEYYTHDNPLQEYTHFVIEIHGFSRDFLAHISRDMKFSRMWAGSNRVMPDGPGFVDKGQYYVPEAFYSDLDKLDKYVEYLTTIQDIMKEASKAGWSTEEVKLLMPHAISIPITISGSFRSIKDMCERRACLHCQDHWYIFISKLAKEFTEKVDPWLAGMLHKPKCIAKKSCHVKMEQLARIEKWPDGRWKDPLEVCPLYVNFEHPNRREELTQMAKEKHPNHSDRVEQFYDLLKNEN